LAKEEGRKREGYYGYDSRGERTGPARHAPSERHNALSESEISKTNRSLARVVLLPRPCSQLNCRTRVFSTTGDFFCRTANFSALLRST